MFIVQAEGLSKTIRLAMMEVSKVEDKLEVW